jgi:hypothetical protein
MMHMASLCRLSLGLPFVRTLEQAYAFSFLCVPMCDLFGAQCKARTFVAVLNAVMLLLC